MRLRGTFVSVATVGLMVGPTFAHGIVSGAAGAAAECTITGTAASDTIIGTTKDDVICTKAGRDNASGQEGNDVIRGGQGDDGGGGNPCNHKRRDPRGFCQSVMHTIAQAFGLHGDGGSDTIKGQQDDDSVEGNGQNDHLAGGQGDDCLGRQCTTTDTASDEPGDDFLKSKDRVSGNDYVDGGDNTDTCRSDSGDIVPPGGCEN